MQTTTNQQQHGNFHFLNNGVVILRRKGVLLLRLYGLVKHQELTSDLKDFGKMNDSQVFAAWEAMNKEMQDVINKHNAKLQEELDGAMEDFATKYERQAVIERASIRQAIADGKRRS